MVVPIWFVLRNSYRVKKLLSLLLCCFLAQPVLQAQATTTSLQTAYRTDKNRFYAYPNGWGSTPEAARKDLARVLSIYKNRPGYKIHDYVRIVPIARGVYQADGCCSFWAKPALVAKDPRRK
jgi:hypothetical protein